MSKRTKKTPDTINPNRIKTRDPLMLRLIQGATKAGVTKNERREADKYRCRESVGEVCRQCFCPEEEFIPTSFPDGFCSDTCKEKYEDEVSGNE